MTVPVVNNTVRDLPIDPTSTNQPGGGQGPNDGENPGSGGNGDFSTPTPVSTDDNPATLSPVTTSQ